MYKPFEKTLVTRAGVTVTVRTKIQDGSAYFPRRGQKKSEIVNRWLKNVTIKVRIGQTVTGAGRQTMLEAWQCIPELIHHAEFQEEYRVSSIAKREKQARKLANRMETKELARAARAAGISRRLTREEIERMKAA